MKGFVKMFSWLSGISTSVILYILGAIAAIGLVVGIYFAVVHQASQTQLLKDQNKQLEQVIKNQDQFIKDTKKLAEDQKKLTDELTDTVKVIQINKKMLEDYLTSAETVKQDRPSSDILKQTVRSLQGKKVAPVKKKGKK